MWIDKKYINSPQWREYYCLGYLDYGRKLNRSGNLRDNIALVAYTNGYTTAQNEDSEEKANGNGAIVEVKHD